MSHKIIPCLVIAAAAAACAPARGPVAYSVPVPAGDGAFACAHRTINEMGFTVTNADREAGFIAAEKYLTHGVTYHDVLSVSIFQAAGASGHTLRVSAKEAERDGDDGERSSGTPSAHGSAAARILAQTCAPGAQITPQRTAAGYTVQARVVR